MSKEDLFEEKKYDSSEQIENSVSDIMSFITKMLGKSRTEAHKENLASLKRIVISAMYASYLNGWKNSIESNSNKIGKALDRVSADYEKQIRGDKDDS